MKALIFISFLFTSPAWAATDVGSAAGNVNEVIRFIYDIIDVILYLGAAVMATSGIMKYRLHRRNPQQMPLGTPVTELSIAAILIIIAVMVQMSESHHSVNTSGGAASYLQAPATGSGELRQNQPQYRAPQSPPQQRPY